MKALVFGSLNIDCVFHLPHLVRAGETIASSAFIRNEGGKGLNQAAALGRAGAETYIAGAIGQDGAFLREFLEECGVRTAYLRTVEQPGGQAIIQVDQSGENAIILYPGANRTIPDEMVPETLSHFSAGDYLLLQNEINQSPRLISEAYERGLITVLNPSPFTPDIMNWPLEKLQWLILNEIEGADMTGLREPESVLDALRSRFPGCGLVLTLGEHGVICDDTEERIRVPAFPVPDPVDTTGAGDTFTGFFIRTRMLGLPLRQGLSIASRAAAAAITRPGAARSIPFWEEIMKDIHPADGKCE